MTPAAPSPPPDPIEDLVFECLEAMATEGTAALDRACAAHPEHAQSLRHRIRALQQSGMVAPEPAPEPMPERLGEFRLLRRLGGGGMGVVYLAWQESLGREVALKLIRPEHLYFAGSRQRFQREVTACARLKHPGIVPVYLVGEAQGIPYFAMERIEGASLAETLACVAGRDPATLAGADLSRAVATAMGAPGAARPDAPLFQGSWVNAAVRVAAQVAEALAHAHERGVVHRDVKPSNVMLTPDGRVLLVDFGLAQSEGAVRLTRSGSALGSLLYMPPEVVRGSAEVGAAADLYSLGATLYELLTLQPPFHAADGEATRRLILAGQPVAPRRRNAAVPWDAETVCLTAMAVEPAQRYANAAALSQDLHRVLELRPILARRPGLLRRLQRAARRSPAGAVAAALAFVLLVLVPGAFAWHQRAARRDAERRGYAGNVAAAANSLRLLDVVEARRMLDHCAEELRGWEWTRLWRRTHRAVAVHPGHGASIEEFAFAPDGTRVAVGDATGHLTLRDAAGQRELHGIHTGTDGGFVALAWQPGGACLLTADGSGAVEVRDGQSLAVLRTFAPRRPESEPRDVRPRAVFDSLATLYTVAWSGDGRRFAAGGLGNELRIHDADDPSAAPLVVPHPGVVRRALWLRDGRHVVTACSDGRVRLVDAAQGQVKRTLDAHRGGTVGLALSADGRRLATCGGDRMIRVWDLQDLAAAPRTLAGHTETVVALAFDRDGHGLASGATDGTARLWNVETGDLRATWMDMTADVKCVRFAPDGARVWTSDRDGRLHQFAVDDVDQLARVTIDSGFLLGVAPTRDGQRLFAVGMLPAVLVLDPRTGARLPDLAQLPREAWHLSLAPDESRLAVGIANMHGPGEVQLLDATTGASLRRWESPDQDGCHVVAFAPDGRSLVFGGQGGRIGSVQIDRDDVRPLAGHDAEVMDLRFSPDGRWLASAGNDQTVRLLPVAGGTQRVLRGHQACVNRVCFTPDGRHLLSGSLDRTIRVWDVASGDCLAVLTGHREAVRALAVTPDGTRLVSGCFGFTLRVWDLDALEPLATLTGHQSPVQQLVFTADGSRLYSVGMQGEIRVW